MAQAALTALNNAAGSWDAKAPHDLRAGDSERFLRVASACAQVAIADGLNALSEAIQALPAAAATLGAVAGNAVAAELAQVAERFAGIQGASAGNLGRPADQAGLRRLQEPPAIPSPPRRPSRLHATHAEAHFGGPHGSNVPMMSQAQMDGMYAVLCDADSAGDAEALADAAWRLYAEAVAARTEREQAQAALSHRTAAAGKPGETP